jgi:hypothetical protein
VALPGLLDRANESTSTLGTGTVTLSGSAVDNSWQTWSNAGAANAATYFYLISDGLNREWGIGTYTSSGTTLARTTVIASIIGGVSGTSKLNLSGSATVASAPPTQAWATLQPAPNSPGGRLTLTSNVPVMKADATAQTSIYYAPYTSALTPIYNGTNWLSYQFSQLTMALDTTNQPTTVVQDLFVYLSSGAPAIGAGPSWSNTATVTMTLANPCVVSWTAHGLQEGAPVIFTTTGALPSAITSGTVYYVGNTPGTNSFNISTSVANAAAGTFISTAAESQSGTHTGTNHTSVRGTDQSHLGPRNRRGHDRASTAQRHMVEQELDHAHERGGRRHERFRQPGDLRGQLLHHGGGADGDELQSGGCWWRGRTNSWFIQWVQ